MKIIVLLSAGRHPASGRPRPVPVELQAIGLARTLPRFERLGLHAGNHDPAVLDALGHGLDVVTILSMAPDHDPLPALVAEIRAQMPDLVIAGRRGMGDSDSGLLPYRIAQACAMPIVADAISLAAEVGRIEIIQALPRGARRRVIAPIPAVVTVHEAAPAPPPFIHRARLAGEIVERRAPAGATAFQISTEIRPYRARPKLIGDGASTGSAEERLRAATETTGGVGRLMVGPTPEEAAAAIIDYVARFRST